MSTSRGAATRPGTVDDAGRLVIRPGLSVPLEEIEFRADPSGGPGGQHANKTSTRVEVRYAVLRSPVFGPRHRALLAEALAARLTADGVLRVVSARERSQLQNRRAALARLAELIARGLERPAPRTATRPTKASQEKRIEAKKKRSVIKAGRRAPVD